MDKGYPKKVLMTASVPSMIGQFNMDNLHLLKEMGYQVHVACNFQDRSVWSEKRIAQFQKTMYENGIQCKQIEFSRSPFSFSRHIRSYQKLCADMRKEKYTFVHCHTPVAAAITRLVAVKTGTRVLYTAHGFHFYRHAPWWNWILYYPLERVLSYRTDILLTMNREDLRLARRYLCAKETDYIPGIGIDTEKFLLSKGVMHSKKEQERFREEKRKQLGLRKEDIVLLSVGELSKRKNHRMVLEALSQIQGTQIRYVICGRGDKEQALKNEAAHRGLSEKVIFAGYRSDVEEFYQMADLFVFPSIQEGLPVALMEAMASGIPCLASDIRGNTDLLASMADTCLFPLDKPKIFLEKMEALIGNPQLRERVQKKNLEEIKKFDRKRVNRQMKFIYEQMEYMAGERRKDRRYS